jgi:general secretion pathway protein B
VETLSTDRPLESAPRPAPPVRDAQKPPAPGNPAGSPASTPPAAAASAERTEAQRRREAQLAALQQAVETTGVPEEARMPPSRNARPGRAPDDGAISFWQLPEMTRDSLPELRINVMVYDEDPAKRFIILGGKRYGEGDEISSNLQLETVQRDRALFRYGAYLFYVKQ